MENPKSILLDKATCPYCDKQAQYTQKTQVYDCKYCGNLFTPEEREKHFYDWHEYVLRASADIHSVKKEDICEYPFEFLTEALTGISKSELVVIGSDAGQGKTQICNDIALHNAARGKNVYLFSLEGDKYETVNRERFKRIADLYYSNPDNKHIITYKNFMLNRLGLDEYEIDVDRAIRRRYKTLHVYTRHKPLNIDILTEQLNLIKDTADLVVIDHLHYFDFGEKEHSEITKILKKIQLLKTTYRIPIVISSHLRKKNKDRVFPDNDDFHGSSNIAKQADTCIIVAPIKIDYEDNSELSTDLYPTGIRITKSRYGISTRTVGVVNFNLRTKQYEREYKMAVVTPGGVKDLAPEYYPQWAKKSVNCAIVPKEKHDATRENPLV